MSSNLVAALMVKLRMLFSESDDAEQQSFLAFCIPGLPMSARDLDFSATVQSSALTPQQALNASANFARLVNRLPKVDSRWSSAGSLLWDEYETILTQAVIASDEPTVGEKEKLKKAQIFLYQQEVTDLLGEERTTIVDSPNLAAYKRYQEAYLQNQSQYNAMKLSADYSTDPTVKEQWRTHEAAYRAQVSTTQNEWVSKGYKAQVEEAFATIDQITGRNPQLSWVAWKNEFSQSKLTDLNNQDFYYTYFYPTDFYKPDSEAQWTTLSLDESEIKKLSLGAVSGADDLRSSDDFSTTKEADLNVSDLSMDVMRVAIMRPWMDPRIFKSRFWNWPDSRELLSSGGASSQGSLPAYITGIIFVRNLEFKLKSCSQGNEEVVKNLNDGNPVSLGLISLEKTALEFDSNSLKSEGMQIIAFICEKLPKSPNPDPMLKWSGPILLDWLSGQLRLDRDTKISKVKVTIHTGNITNAGTDADVDFRVNNGDWWRLDKTFINDFERNDTATYGPFDTPNLTVENIARVPIELKHNDFGVAAGWYVERLQLEVYVDKPGIGWKAYKEWKPGWLATDEGDGSIYRKLQ